MKCPYCDKELQMVVWIPNLNGKEYFEYYCPLCRTEYFNHGEADVLWEAK